MPTIVLQVGQCGNQLGQAFWGAVASDPGSAASSARAAAAGSAASSKAVAGSHSSNAGGGAFSWQMPEDSEFIRVTSQGQRRARCLMVDTEPKVVNTLLAAPGPTQGLFARDRCFLGQSGRGNNWAFGYSQLLPKTQGPKDAAAPQWDWRTAVEDPNAREYQILDLVVEGLRREAEEADCGPNFLLLHSLGGGSGSGLGSRILEHVREEYPLNFVGTVSVAPRPAGDSPLQALNTTMALSFLQAYADVVMWYDNQTMMEAATKVSRGAACTLADVNKAIAGAALGALWPMGPTDVGSGGGRIRDMVTSVASDPCLKLVEARTASVLASFGSQGLWRDASKAATAMFPRFDVLGDNGPVFTSSVMLVGRGFPDPRQAAGGKGPANPAGGSQAKAGVSRGRPVSGSAAGWKGEAGGLSTEDAAITSTFMQAWGGKDVFACPADAQGSVFVRQGPSRVPGDLPGCTAPATGASTGSTDSSGNCTLSVVANRSSAIGMLSSTAARARSICEAGAYMHWYERYGCSREALQEGMRVVEDMADAYRLAHGVREFL